MNIVNTYVQTDVPIKFHLPTGTNKPFSLCTESTAFEIEIEIEIGIEMTLYVNYHFVFKITITIYVCPYMGIFTMKMCYGGVVYRLPPKQNPDYAYIILIVFIVYITYSLSLSYTFKSTRSKTELIIDLFVQFF